ncbi:substrate-binding periplasmic protein [Spartinivicinus ruber]|uniref:substrate-binding periplasmic protein n=1 Tax=Spartinivicinus ruber TaxID=2683272 RepID=UPI0013D81F1D|nr:transporter substrate-binding domain-containing protein [Spartinivicinus ruber]
MKIFTILILLVSFFSNAKEAEKLLKITTGEYPPWSSVAFKHGGFVLHVITEAFRRNNYEVEFAYYPWARSYKEGAKGKFHATAFWFCVPKRQIDFYCSEPLFQEDFVFFHLKSTDFKKWTSLEDLEQYRIDATREYSYTPEFWEAKETGSLNIIVSNTDEINFNMLFKKRIDLFLMSTVAGYTLMNKKFSKSMSQMVTNHYFPLVSNTTHLLFPRNREDSFELINIFNKGIKSLKADGTYDKFYDALLRGDYEKK